MGTPATIMAAPSTAVRAATGPTDRSIPPDMITSVIPNAMQALIEDCCSTFIRLGVVKNVGDMLAKTAEIRINPIGVPASRKRKLERSLVMGTSRRWNGVAGDVRLGDLAGVQGGDDTAFAHHQDTIGQTDHLGHFGRHEENGLAVRGEAFDQIVNLGLGTDVDAGGGLLEQEYLGARRQPATDDGLLLVAPEKLPIGRKTSSGRRLTSRISASVRAFSAVLRIRAAREKLRMAGRAVLEVTGR